MAFIPMEYVWRAFPKATADKFFFHTAYCTFAFFTPWAWVFLFGNKPEYSTYTCKPYFTYKYYLAYKHKTGAIDADKYHAELAKAGFH